MVPPCSPMTAEGEILPTPHRTRHLENRRCPTRARPLRRVRRFWGRIRKIVLHPPLHRLRRAQKSPGFPGLCASPKCLIHLAFFVWRRDPESNRARRICNPLHNRFAIAPGSALRPLFSAKKKGSRGFPVFLIWSGIRGSNSRPISWQGIALPTELIPHVFHATRREPDRVPIQSPRVSYSMPPSTTAASGCGYQ